MLLEVVLDSEYRITTLALYYSLALFSSSDLRGQLDLSSLPAVVVNEQNYCKVCSYSRDYSLASKAADYTIYFEYYASSDSLSGHITVRPGPEVASISAKASPDDVFYPGLRVDDQIRKESYYWGSLPLETERGTIETTSTYELACCLAEVFKKRPSQSMISQDKTRMPTNCAVNAVWLLANCYHEEVDVPDLTELASRASSDGALPQYMTVAEVVALAQSVGCAAQCYAISNAELQLLDGPMILLATQPLDKGTGHYFWASRVSDSHFVVCDPPNRPTRVNENALFSSTGRFPVIVVYPSDIDALEHQERMRQVLFLGMMVAVGILAVLLGRQHRRHRRIS